MGPQDLMKEKLLIPLIVLIIICTRCLYAGEFNVIQKKDVSVFFDPPLRFTAQEVGDMYPDVKYVIEDILGWDLNVRPSVLLIKDRRRFQRMAESPLTVAFAVPGRNLIVIDHSRMNIHPFSLENILKHELCHLLLHHHIKQGILPKWLDEGVCQWVSDGIADIIMEQKRSLLNKAALRGRFIRLGSLQKGFPPDRDRLLLAYEESKSFVSHIIGEYGKDGILKVLKHMKNGEHADVAVLKAFSVPLDVLEKQWHRSLRQKMTWFTYLSYHLYEILFALMALIAVYASIKMIIRKRTYMKEETEM